MENVIRTEQVGRCFKTSGGDFWALRNVSVEVPEGSLTILRGRSGSGKTTLMNLLGALDRPSAGKVFFQEQEISRLDERSSAALRRKNMGFVFQSVALIPMLNALENVEFALRLAGVDEGRTDRAMECLELVGLASRARHMPQEMSGGEQQRVAIARAIAHQPHVIFADEPTGALDTRSGLAVVKVFKQLVAEQHTTIVMTTHDVGLMELGDKVYELEGGEIKHD